MELAEVRVAAELELKAKLLEAAQAELGRAQAELSKRETAVAAAEQAARSAAASARDRAANSQAASADAERALAAQRQQLEKVRGGWLWLLSEIVPRLFLLYILSVRCSFVSCCHYHIQPAGSAVLIFKMEKPCPMLPVLLRGVCPAAARAAAQ
jgi:multidrug efflux pump subunit AcrA (membrane-fusion protein)